MPGTATCISEVAVTRDVEIFSLILSFSHSFIHLLHSRSYNRSTVSYKQVLHISSASPLKFQYIHKAIQQLLVFTPIFKSLSFYSMFYMTVSTQDMANPVSPPLVFVYVRYTLPPSINVIFPHLSQQYTQMIFSILLQHHKSMLIMQHFISFFPKFLSNLLVEIFSSY